MVSGIGQAVRAVSGARDLPWVDIHVQQEPDHVALVGESVSPVFTAGEAARVMVGAEAQWRLWNAFFSELLDSFCDQQWPAQRIG